MYTQLSLFLPHHETMVRSHMPSARAGRNPSRGRRVKYMYLECIFMYLKCILNAPFYSKRVHVSSVPSRQPRRGMTGNFWKFPGEVSAISRILQP